MILRGGKKVKQKAKDQSQKKEPEIWDLVRQIPYTEKNMCHQQGCNLQAIAMWASNLTKTGEEWLVCEDCQVTDFGGWPEGEIPIREHCNVPVALTLMIENNDNKSSSNAIIKSNIIGNYQGKSATKNTQQINIESKDQYNIDDNMNGNKDPGNNIPLSRLFSKDNKVVKEESKNKTGNISGITMKSTMKSSQTKIEVLPSETQIKYPLAGLNNPRAPFICTDLPSSSLKTPTVDNTKRTLATICKWVVWNSEGAYRKPIWSETKTLLSMPRQDELSLLGTRNGKVINLRRGGTLKIYPNVLTTSSITKVKDELLSCGFFRQYRIQAQDEPRLHFLLHDEATDDDDFESSKQPGYKYASVKIKARPLNKLSEVSQLSQEMARLSGVDKWTIGVNPVLYRDYQDKMGGHADDDQGEQVILCLVVASPLEPRRIVITPKIIKQKPLLEENDEKIELTLIPGDAYEMDGEMQKHYIHSVPKDRDKEKTKSCRMVIVFRTGDKSSFYRDTGTACTDLSPRQPKMYVFGNKVANLEEGEIYTRPRLFEICAHLMQQRGISGNREKGCDAIIVSGLREDKLGSDYFLKLMYAAESAKGALSVLTSHQQKKPIRIFRSSGYMSPFHAVRSSSNKSKVVYRYDGLYQVVRFKKPEREKGPYQFWFERLEAGINDDMMNNISNCNFATHCERRGTLLCENERARVSQELLNDHWSEAMIGPLRLNQAATTFEGEMFQRLHYASIPISKAPLVRQLRDKQKQRRIMSHKIGPRQKKQAKLSQEEVEQQERLPNASRLSRLEYSFRMDSRPKKRLKSAQNEVEMAPSQQNHLKNVPGLVDMISLGFVARG